jgi:hypothetical protein
MASLPPWRAFLFSLPFTANPGVGTALLFQPPVGTIFRLSFLRLITSLLPPHYSHL